MVAGAFVGVVGRSSAQSVAYFMLSLIPARYAAVVLFLVACFVSLAMGTSVGTITLLVPIAVEVSHAASLSVPLCVGIVVGGAMGNASDAVKALADLVCDRCECDGIAKALKQLDLI